MKKTDSYQEGPFPEGERRGRPVDPATADRMASIFRVLADPTRVRILSALARSELCVGELAACLEMTVSAISHQLRLLRRMRLVRPRREGKHVYYALDDDHVEKLFHQAMEHVEEQVGDGAGQTEL